MPEPPERTALYRFYDADDQLLYIGISKNPRSRWSTHALFQPWWHLVARKSVEWYEDRDSALAAEVRTTAAEKPLYDRSSRSSSDDPHVRFDDSDGVQAIVDGLTSKIKDGVLPVGTRLAMAAVAKEYNVSAITACKAMSDLAWRDKILIPGPHGRFFVAEP